MKQRARRGFAATLLVVSILALMVTGSVSGSGRLAGSQTVQSGMPPASAAIAAITDREAKSSALRFPEPVSRGDN